MWAPPCYRFWQAAPKQPKMSSVRSSGSSVPHIGSVGPLAAAVNELLVVAQGHPDIAAAVHHVTQVRRHPLEFVSSSYILVRACVRVCGGCSC